MAEKKRIQGFLHYRTDLGDGVRTGIVFSDCTELCSRCCSSFQFLPDHEFCEDTAEKSEYSSQELLRYLQEEKTMYYAKELGISFLGKEPLRDPFFCSEVAQGLKELGMGLQIYTCGMCSMTAFDLMDGLVDLYFLRAFLPFFSENVQGAFHQGEQLRRIAELLDTRGTPYRFLLPVLPSGNVLDTEAFAEYALGLKKLKSVVLDFSNCEIPLEEQNKYRMAFLKRKIPLY